MATNQRQSSNQSHETFSHPSNPEMLRLPVGLGQREVHVEHGQQVEPHAENEDGQVRGGHLQDRLRRRRHREQHRLLRP